MTRSTIHKLISATSALWLLGCLIVLVIPWQGPNTCGPERSGLELTLLVAFWIVVAVGPTTTLLVHRVASSRSGPIVLAAGLALTALAGVGVALSVAMHNANRVPGGQVLVGPGGPEKPVIEVLLDGETVGRAVPLNIPCVPNGDHVIEARFQSGEVERQPFTIDPDGVKAFEFGN